jgi:hypothetical protein
LFKNQQAKPRPGYWANRENHPAMRSWYRIYTKIQNGHMYTRQNHEYGWGYEYWRRRCAKTK